MVVTSVFFSHSIGGRQRLICNDILQLSALVIVTTAVVQFVVLHVGQIFVEDVKIRTNSIQCDMFPIIMGMSKQTESLNLNKEASTVLRLKVF